MEEVEVPPGLIEIGETLRAARESHGLSLDTAAAQLRSDARVVEALEHGRFGELGPPVFARGHLLRYATLLGEPGEAMVEEWSASPWSRSLAAPRRADRQGRGIAT